MSAYLPSCVACRECSTTTYYKSCSGCQTRKQTNTLRKTHATLAAHMAMHGWNPGLWDKCPAVANETVCLYLLNDHVHTYELRFSQLPADAMLDSWDTLSHSALLRLAEVAQRRGWLP